MSSSSLSCEITGMLGACWLGEHHPFGGALVITSMDGANGVLFLVSFTCCIGAEVTSIYQVGCAAVIMGEIFSTLTLAAPYAPLDLANCCMGNLGATSLNINESCLR